MEPTIREGLANLIEALTAAHGPLEEVLACPEGDVRERARLVLATTAAIDVFESACGFLQAVAGEGCQDSPEDSSVPRLAAGAFPCIPVQERGQQ